MKVAFRCDASIGIGSGHVMRCLTLAHALREQGGDCMFLCREHQGDLLEFVRKQGFMTIRLPQMAGCRSNLLAKCEEELLGANWFDDAQECLAKLAHVNDGEAMDWLVVDHYGADYRWEKIMRAACAKLMVIDDLANRQHDCDLLLDQNIDRDPQDYADLVPAPTTALTGTRYALLRPEFAKNRELSLSRRNDPALRNVLVNMGGMDSDNVTVDVLNALHDSNLPVDVKITVVMGEKAPWLDAVLHRAATMKMQTVVRVAVRDMARLMVNCDLMIGAGGGTTWERCVLGLPAITVVVAKNQEEVARKMARLGGTLLVARGEDFGSALVQSVNSVSLDVLSRLSNVSREVCDGSGTTRVVRAMTRDERKGKPNGAFA